jgi:tetratricopeptide (TPR) repeat protein
MTARTSAGWALSCAFVAVLVHWRALGNGFALDDVQLVESNPAIVSLAHVPRLFIEPYRNVAGEHYGLYRPLTVASWAIDRSVFGAGPLGFHLVNVVLHAGVAALAWFALRRAGTHYGTALLGGMLFAVLPIHTEAVANIAGRSELLAAMFVLVAWLAHARAGSEGRAAVRWRLVAALAYFAAILSKESAALAPLLFFADDALRARESPARNRATAAGYATALVAMLALRLAALGGHQTAEATIALDNPAAAAGAWPRLATAVWVQLKYALVCVAPRQLVSDYSYDAIPVAHSVFDPRVACGFAFLGSLAAAGWWGWRHSRPVALAVVVWSVFFLASANILFPTGTIMAERLAYLPSLGVCLAVGHLGAAFAARHGTAVAMRTRRISVVIAAAVLVATYAVRTNARVPDWKDNVSLAMADVAKSPRSAKLQAGAGMVLADAGRAGEAEEHLRRAIAIYPDYAQMHYNLAVLLVRRGARDEAVVHLRRAIELVPENPLPRRLLEQLRQ